MQFITKPIKFVMAIPFYAIAFIATVFILLSTRVLDRLYPNAKTSITFMRALLGFNSSDVDMEGKANTLPWKIYK